MKVLLTFSDNHVTFDYRFLDQNGRPTTFIDLPVACSRFLCLLYIVLMVREFKNTLWRLPNHATFRVTLVPKVK